MVEGIDFEGYDPDSATGCWVRLKHFYSNRENLPNLHGRFYPYFPAYPGFHNPVNRERWLSFVGKIEGSQVVRIVDLLNQLESTNMQKSDWFLILKFKS